MISQGAWCLLCSVVLLLSFLSGIEGAAAADPIIRTRMATLGGVRETQGNQNSAEIEDLARFAVREHNKKENSLLEFGRVVKAKEQVVAGTLYHLTLEAAEAGKNKLYEAKVWVKPWMHFKELQEFKIAGDSSCTPADLGAK